jgi:hypothetical protein
MSGRPISPHAREPLAKLMPRLASTYEGERIATVAAIERVLVAEGLDWHDFTAAIAQQPKVAPPPPDDPPPQPPAYQFAPAWKLLETIDAIEANGLGVINVRSIDFLADLRRMAYRFDPVRLSPKQCRWLDQLIAQTGALS